MNPNDISLALLARTQAALHMAEHPEYNREAVIQSLAIDAWRMGALAGAQMALQDPAIHLASTEYTALMQRLTCRVQAADQAEPDQQDRK